MTDYQKIEQIANFVSDHEYEIGYTSVQDIVILGKGDCWGSIDAVNCMAHKLGFYTITQYFETGSHRNNWVIVSDGTSYLVDATCEFTPTIEREDDRYIVTNDYCGQLLDDDTIKIIQYRGEESDISVPKSIEGKQVSIIGQEVFIDHSELTSVTLPDGLTTIEKNVFSGCKNLEQITFPDTLSYISAQGGLYSTSWFYNRPEGASYAGGVFMGWVGNATDVKEVILKEGTLGICKYAFWSMEDLESVTIPDGCLYIYRR